MNKTLILLSSLFLLLNITGFAGQLSSPRENRVVIKFSSSAFSKIPGPAVAGKRSHAMGTPERFMVKYKSSITELQPYPVTGWYIAQVNPGIDREDVCKRLRKEPWITDASPDYTVSISSAVIPDDTLFNYQYALNNTGQAYHQTTGATGSPGSDIKALDGWLWTTGLETMVIAVVDTGVALGHEDLVNKLIPGYNVLEDNQNPADDHGHGTFVASIAGAETNNGKGIAGVCRNAVIMPIKAVAADGNGSYLAIAAAIRYAVDHGAQVINLSLGGNNPSFILEDACAYAFNQGVVLVAATGNEGGTVLYPAAYDNYVLAVGASDANDQWAGFSNHGPSVDVVAPGRNVLGALFSPESPEDLSSYVYGYGTSFAAPHVSGAAGLLLSLKPSLTVQQVYTLIKITADDINADTYPGVDEFTGYGRINLKTLLGPYIL